MKAKLFLWLTFFILSSNVNADDFVTLVSSGAGNLQLTDDALMATKLRVEGHIDARDFQTLKKVTINRTRVLDLSNAVIDAYKGYGCYANISSSNYVYNIEIDYAANELPQHAFVEARDNSLGSKWHAGSASLCELILPKSLTGISPGAFIDCKALSKVYTKDGSELLSENNAIVYTKDKKRIVQVAPGYCGGFEVPSSVTIIDSCALMDATFSYLRFKSGKLPKIYNSSLVNAAYIIAIDAVDCALVFPDADCVESIETITVNNVQSGTLLETIGNKGYTRKNVRSVKVTGTLNADDISALCSLPNLYYADLSGARIASTSTKIIFKDSKLVDVKLPSGSYHLVMQDNPYMCGELCIPEGVYALDYNNVRHSLVSFPSTLREMYSFNNRIIERADLSACSKMTSLHGFSGCMQMEELILPHALETLRGVYATPIKKIVLPKGLKYWKDCKGWEIESLVLPESLLEIECVKDMPLLKSIDASAAVQLTSVSYDAFNECPFVEIVDFSNSPLKTLEGFYYKTPVRAIASGGTRFPAPCIANRLKKVVLPPTLEYFDAFWGSPLLTELRLDHCCNLEVIKGLQDCTNLESLYIPSGLKEFALTLSGNDNLVSIYTAAHTPPTVSSNTIKSKLSEISLYVPVGKVGIYGMNEWWGDCKEVKEYGYTVNCGEDGAARAIGCCGIYEKGSKVTLTAAPYVNEKSMLANCVAWEVNGEIMKGATVSFSIDQHCEVAPVYGFSAADLKLADLYFELESETGGAHEIYLYGLDDVEVYDEKNGRICKSNNGGSSISIELDNGTNKYAVLGDVSIVDLNEQRKDNVTLKNIIFNNKESVERLSLQSLELNSLDISGLSKIQTLDCSSNNLELLDLSSCNKLQRLYLSNNKLKSLDLRNCQVLSTLSCDYNMLRTLLIDKCYNLEYLYVSSNELKSLDIVSDKLQWASWGGNAMAFTFMTPKLYDNLINNGLGECYSQSYEILPDMIDESGVIDLTHELYSNEYSKDTKIEFTQSKEFTEKISDGKYLLKNIDRFYIISFTNSNFPRLSFEACFRPKSLTGIADINLDKLEISINEHAVVVRGVDDGAEAELISLDGVVLQHAVFVNGAVSLETNDSEKICLLKIKNGGCSQTFKIKAN